MKISEVVKDSGKLKIVKNLISLENNRAELFSLLDKGKFPRTKFWVDNCYNLPKTHEIILAAIDETIEGHGVEAIEKPSSMGCGRFQDYISYINMGDSYAPTILHDETKTRSFFASTVGDVVEKFG